MKSLRYYQFVSLLIALMLSILPLPLWVSPYRPQLLVLVVLFWIFYAPNLINIFLLMGLGLIVDVLQVSILGEHGFALILVYALSFLFVRRFCFFSLMQQMLLVAFLCFFYQLVISLLEILKGHSILIEPLLIAPLASMLFWPWLVHLRFVNE